MPQSRYACPGAAGLGSEREPGGEEAGSPTCPTSTTEHQGHPPQEQEKGR